MYNVTALGTGAFVGAAMVKLVASSLIRIYSVTGFAQIASFIGTGIRCILCIYADGKKVDMLGYYNYPVSQHAIFYKCHTYPFSLTFCLPGKMSPPLPNSE